MELNQKADMNAIQQKMKDDCKFTLSYLINNIKLSQATFPLLPITYTLWRGSTYESIYCQMQKYPKCTLQQLNYAFFQVSQQFFLTQFIEKVENQMNKYCRGLKDIRSQFKGIQKFEEGQQQAYTLVLQLGEKVWQQQLYIELLFDLLHLPYIQIVSKKSSIIVKGEYQTGYSNSYEYKPRIVEKIVDKVGETFISKTLNSLTQLLFSRAFVIQINTLVGTFNPILMGASYGLSSFMKYRKQQKQEQVLIDQLRSALEASEKKVQTIQALYHQIINKLNCVVSGILSEQQKLKSMSLLKNMFLEVFEEQWLQIQVTQDEDGFEVVCLEEKQSFQELV